MQAETADSHLVMSEKTAIAPEIQGLRAIAVALVVLFHIWPDLVPGGYVGVDVFFVISGYLITGQLARMAFRDGRIALGDFYVRRIRRLLPAATVVLLATAIGTVYYLPPFRWEDTAQQIAASALYVQNLFLARLSVDYLAAEQAATPVQHYWSLSVEEQFYLIWPLVMIAAIAAAQKLSLPLLRVFFVALLAIFAASLAASVLLTSAEPAEAYFVTHTRIWELALGGLLAFVISRLGAGPKLRAGLVLTGLAAIAAAALFFSTKTDFPGLAALLPTLGAVLVITGGNVSFGWFRGLDAAVLRYIGDRSYSIYLWHFPLVTFNLVRRDAFGVWNGAAILITTLVISHLSYRFIEMPFRHPKRPGEKRAFAFGLASIVVCLVGAALVRNAVAVPEVSVIEANDARYPGPAVLLDGAPVPDGVAWAPPLEALGKNVPAVYELGCHQNTRSAKPVSCSFGKRDGSETMVVFGDSHAAQWVPALERIALEQGWHVLTFTKSSCPFARIDMRVRNKPYPSCSQWRENAIAAIKDLKPGIVFTAQKARDIPGQDMVGAIESVWRELAATGARVVAIDDTPEIPFDPAECLSVTPERCSVPLAEALKTDHFAEAAGAVAGVKVVDMTDAICGPTTCEAVVGNMIVWRDTHHLSATYAAALAPVLADRSGVGITP